MGPALKPYQLAGAGHRISGAPCTLLDALELGMTIRVPVGTRENAGLTMWWTIGPAKSRTRSEILAWTNHPKGGRCVGRLGSGASLPGVLHPEDARSGEFVHLGTHAEIAQLVQKSCEPLVLGLAVAHAFRQRRKVA